MQAQMLRTRRTRQIGVIMPKLSSESCARMVEGISRVPDEQGYQLLLVNTANENEREVKALDALRRSDIPAQNVHFLPYVTFCRIPFANFMIFAEKPPFCEKTLDSAHNFLYNKQRNNKGYVCL